MKYLFRLVVYAVIFFFAFSVSYVLLLRVVPVTVMPVRIIRMFDGGSVSAFPQARWRPLGKISNQMAAAVIASEDNKFAEHKGFDWDAIEKARKHNKNSNRIRGASTISQQTAKNVFCTHRRTWLRKGFETYYTFLIETLWGKRRIMEVYLNVIETHRDVYGAEATARRFYNKKAAGLNAYEASMIATVLPNPHRMKLEAPSQYMVGRASRIRGIMNKLPKPQL